MHEVRGVGAIPLPEADRIERLFEHPVVAVVEGVGAVPSPRFSEEWDHVARAVPKRQAEFLTARACARRALERLGYPAMPLVPKADRSPTWPRGTTGSITHAGACCAVVVADSPPVRSVGVDIELGDPLSPELERQICTTQEIAFLDSATGHGWSRGLLAKLLFNTKETTYKCQYPISSVMLDFHDVDMRLDLERATFRATILTPAAVERLGTDVLAGRFAIAGGYILSGCAIAL